MVSAQSVNGGCPAPVWPSVQPLVSILSKLTYFLSPCHTVASVNISSSKGVYQLPCASCLCGSDVSRGLEWWKHTGVPL